MKWGKWLLSRIESAKKIRVRNGVRIHQIQIPSSGMKRDECAVIAIEWRIQREEEKNQRKKQSKRGYRNTIWDLGAQIWTRGMKHKTETENGLLSRRIELVAKTGLVDEMKSIKRCVLVIAFMCICLKYASNSFYVHIYIYI